MRRLELLKIHVERPVGGGGQGFGDEGSFALRVDRARRFALDTDVIEEEIVFSREPFGKRGFLAMYSVLSAEYSSRVSRPAAIKFATTYSNSLNGYTEAMFGSSARIAAPVGVASSSSSSLRRSWSIALAQKSVVCSPARRLRERAGG